MEPIQDTVAVSVFVWSKDPSADVRSGVTLALAGIGKAAIPALREALKDESPAVRQAAASALKRIQATK